MALERSAVSAAAPVPAIISRLAGYRSVDLDNLSSWCLDGASTAFGRSRLFDRRFHGKALLSQSRRLGISR